MRFAPILLIVRQAGPRVLRARISSFFLWVALLQRHEQSRARGAPFEQPPSILNSPLCHEAAHFRRP